MTNHEENELKVDNLSRYMYLISGQLQQLSETVAKFVKYKSCQNNYINLWIIVLEGVVTGQKKVENTNFQPKRQHQLPLQRLPVLTKMQKLFQSRRALQMK